jgi:hypothetical protein
VTYLAIAVLALVGFLVYRDLLWEQRVGKLELERAQERQAAADERRELYQRIQAPEAAVVEHVRANRPDRRRARPIAADDDAAYKKRKEEAENG